MIRTILQQYREQAAFNRDMGDRFERLICAYLKLDPQYVALFSDVWLWKDWPEREQFGYQLRDTGIDLVAKLRDEDGYCAIQCKFHDSQITLSDLGNFFTLSGRGGFTRRLIVATAPLTENAAKALDGQVIPVSLLTLEDLEASPIDWSQFSLDEPDKLRKHTPKTPLPHQKEALANVLEGFKKHDRGKLIMACGTGKTYTSLLIAENLVKPGGHLLFLVPSIALLSQSLRAWTADASMPLRCFAVCSDSKASRNDEDMRIFELAYPATTDAAKLARSMQATYDPDRLTVVFSTYQSIAVVHEAQKITGVEFDLIICDEAHRTAGYTPKGEDHSAFVRVHDNEYIRGRHRLYMTATPRLYAESTKNKARKYEVEVFSMDDEATFGPEFHRLRFDEAVERGLLSDYKVLVIAVDEYHVNRVLGVRIADDGDELKLDDAVKIVGCWHGLAKRLSEEDTADQIVDPHPMRTAIAFAGTIKNSKLFAKEFERISTDLRGRSESELPALEARHVDGSMNVVERNQRLTWLKENTGTDEPVCRILTNARCLSEGVDVPALDAAIFLNPRDSVVDVVQSVGRVMRKTPGKKYGYVILPIGVRKDASPETALDDNKKYRVVWQVLNALRAHDDRLDKQFARIDLTGDKNGVVNVIGVGGGEEKDDRFTQMKLAFDPIELEKWKDAIYGKIVHKCGNRRYWEDWAKDVALIAERHEMRIRALLENPTPQQREAFDTFLNGLRKNLNPSIDRDAAIEMLAQHIITKPVFDALFENYAFAKHNPVSRSMQAIMDVLDSQALNKEHETLEGFYASVRERVSGINDPAGRQKIMVELYEKFFKTAFPRMVDRLGIVYTPVEIVDFILKSADEALKEHFGCRLQDEGVHILDPFTGTGTFMVRLIESDLIPKEKLIHKYRHELHANEIVLLAYYIAAINIEEALHRTVGGDYEPFPGIVLTDTFQLNEVDGRLDLDIGIPENSARAQRQKSRDIRVIIGNPPYSVGQSSGNDNNQNPKYEKLDQRIAETYALHSTATLKNSLYDSYIRAFRWASDRIGNEGVICFVTNAGWIDGNAMDGFRKVLEDEFSAIYVFNLRGNARTQGEQRKKEAGNVFGEGSRTPVAITLLVKKAKAAYHGKAKIYYHDIGDYLSRDEKLARIAKLGSYTSIPWQKIEPNEHHDWINQRTDEFESFLPFSNAGNMIFGVNSNGVKTNRDVWVYDFSRSHLEAKMRRMIDFYNKQMQLHGSRLRTAGQDAPKLAAKLIDRDPRKIKWTRELIADLCRQRECSYHEDRVRVGLYRPFVKQWMYFDRRLNNCVYQMPKLYPTATHENLVISVTGKGESKEFSCLIVNALPNHHLISGCRCFPLYYYERDDSGEQINMFVKSESQSGYIRKDGVTDAALRNFQLQYRDARITKEDIFYYCYGVLHSPEYREAYSADLRKSLPRIPYAPDFWAFSKAGRELAHWHLNYETVDPWPVTEVRQPQGTLDDFTYYEVDSMTFASSAGREKDKSVIIYNDRITLKDIPIEAYNYVVNGQSAIEWIMDQYRVKVDPDSGIRSDPNAWCREHNDPAYILNLLKRVIRVSMETNRIVANLPSLELERTSA